MPTNDPRPTKAVRRDEARVKAAQMRKEQERKAKRNRIVGISVLVLAVLALGFVAYKIVSESKSNASANSDVVYGDGSSNVIPPTLKDVSSPAPAGANGGIPVSGNGADAVGKVGDGDTVLTIYFDFMCPVCGNFEKINSADIETILADGGTTIEYHPISFLDGNSSGTSYSTRAANAAAIVADKSPEHFAEFVSKMYVDQPAEGSSGRSPTTRSRRSPRTSASRRTSRTPSRTPWTERTRPVPRRTPRPTTAPGGRSRRGSRPGRTRCRSTASRSPRRRS